MENPRVGRKLGRDNFRIAEWEWDGVCLRGDIGTDQTGKVILFSAHLANRGRVEGRLPRPAGLSKRGASSSAKQRHGYRNAAWKRSNRVPAREESFSRGIRSRADLRIS